MRVRQRSGLGDHVMRRRLLVHRGGTDEYELLHAIAEQRQVALDVDRMVGDPIDDDVELVICQGTAGFGGVADIRAERFHARHFDLALPAIEVVQVDSALNRQAADRRADEPRAADEEDFHDEIALKHPSCRTRRRSRRPIPKNRTEPDHHRQGLRRGARASRWARCKRRLLADRGTPTRRVRRRR